MAAKGALSIFVILVALSLVLAAFNIWHGELHGIQAEATREVNIVEQEAEKDIRKVGALLRGKADLQYPKTLSVVKPSKHIVAPIQASTTPAVANLVAVFDPKDAKAVAEKLKYWNMPTAHVDELTNLMPRHEHKSDFLLEYTNPCQLSSQLFLGFTQVRHRGNGFRGLQQYKAFF
jgi:hypothetical protein